MTQKEINQALKEMNEIQTIQEAQEIIADRLLNGDDYALEDFVDNVTAIVYGQTIGSQEARHDS